MEKNLMNKENKITSKCPLCKKPTDPKYRPFCSDRCQKIDLHRWVEGVYKIETDENADSSKNEDHEN